MTFGSAKRRRRGQPLLALAVLLLAWAGARAMLWESPFADSSAVSKVAPVVAQAGSPPVAKPPQMVRSPGVVTVMPGNEPLVAGARSSVSASLQGPAAYRIVEPIRRTETPPADVISALIAGERIRPISTGPTAAVVPAMTGARAWRVDGWMAWRSGSGLPQAANGARPASYGGTQAGLAMRYDLSARDGRRPALHLRATHAPDRPRQSEPALGFGLRPLAGIPVRVQGEARATRSAGGTELRPAALAYTELAPIDLPLGLTGEGYAQGGWVGGRNRTPFADGQVRITGSLVQAGPVRLRAGAGVWGGAQKFAMRVDVGPTLGLELAAGPAPLRLSVDYRRRVAGEASPGNGFALTLSTGF